MTTGKIEIRAEALEPIHHGAGTVGNVQLLRKQEIVTADGRRVAVPFISGNSFKHRIRWGCSMHALEAMGIEPGSLTKPVVDLLFSGGQLTRAGGNVQLEQARELGRLFPALSLLGYGAGNSLRESRLSVRHFHLVCDENRGRAPADSHPAMIERRAGFFLAEDFGTRHDAARSSVGQVWLTAGDAAAREAALARRGAADTAGQARGDSAQMIYSFQTVRAGSRWWSSLHFTAASDMELLALRAGLSRACEGVHPAGLVYTLGAKASVGYGRMAFQMRGHQLAVRQPVYQESAQLTAFSEVDAYVQHLRTEREAIIEALKEAAA